MLLIPSWIRAIIVGIRMLEARNFCDSEAAHWAHSVIPRHLWLLVAARLYVEPTRASPELNCAVMSEQGTDAIA